MRQTKAPANDAAVAKQPFDLFGSCTGGHIKIFGLDAQHDVAHTATHQKRLMTAFAQLVEHFESVGRDQPARDRMLCATNDAGRGRVGLR